MRRRAAIAVAQRCYEMVEAIGKISQLADCVVACVNVVDRCHQHRDRQLHLRSEPHMLAGHVAPTTGFAASS